MVMRPSSRKNLYQRENYSFFGRQGLLYNFATLICNARLKGSEGSDGPFFLDLLRAHQVFCPQKLRQLGDFAAIRGASSCNRMAVRIAVACAACAACGASASAVSCAASATLARSARPLGKL
jgi:hypothetical protein